MRFREPIRGYQREAERDPPCMMIELGSSRWIRSERVRGRQKGWRDRRRGVSPGQSFQGGGVGRTEHCRTPVQRWAGLARRRRQVANSRAGLVLGASTIMSVSWLASRNSLVRLRWRRPLQKWMYSAISGPRAVRVWRMWCGWRALRTFQPQPLCRALYQYSAS